MKKELTVEEIQKGSFNVLLKIKQIFDDHNWHFYLAYGTLIGAVRHKGFIPWDDDIDIWVKRKDYEAFVQYCVENKESLYPYEIIHYRTNHKYTYPIARFSDSRYSIKYRGIKDYGLGLFVDIYPLDEIDKNDIRFYKKQTAMKNDINFIHFISKSFLKNIIKRVLTPFILLKHGVFSKRSLLMRIDKKAQKYNGTGKHLLNIACWEFDKQSYNVSDIDGENTVWLDFMGAMMPVPYNYDKILKMRYGDYMVLPPVVQRVGHHDYIAFEK